MDLAILITNTDDSAFARAHDDDGIVFAELIALARPQWRCTPYWLCRDEFPADLAAHDGAMMTGSPASVNDDLPWIARSVELVRGMMERRQPLFAACFGHQLVGRALGAPVVANPGGWGHGLLHLTRAERAPWSGPEDIVRLYGSHCEQVAHLPEGARLLFRSPEVPVAGFAVDSHVFTVQHHPEMTDAFIADLVEEYAEELGPDVTARARASLRERADRAAFAEEIARFFETAAARAAREG